VGFPLETEIAARKSLWKILSLLRLICKTYEARFFKGIRCLYFSPGGPSFSAVYRDCIYLLATRPFMRGTMLAFHSSGVASYIHSLSLPMRPIVRYAFSRVELAIQLSAASPPDGVTLHAKQVTVIPNAVPDKAKGWFPRKNSGVFRIIYMGLVTVDKGVLDLLRACRVLGDKKIIFELLIVGSFVSPEEETLLRRTAEYLPQGSVIFSGPLTGDAKEEALRSADVFCFPSFWHTETFPLVLLEALCFGLPIVASRWRGIPDLLGTLEECGTLVDIHALDQISSVLEALAKDPTLREVQSRNARLRYERFFTMKPFLSAYDSAFRRLVES
jgi:glycosyltransferase involved in cell wall biosynthesis